MSKIFSVLLLLAASLAAQSVNNFGVGGGAFGPGSQNNFGGAGNAGGNNGLGLQNNFGANPGFGNNYKPRGRFVYIVFPPSTGSQDYTNLTAAGSVWDNPLVDGVTVQISMNAVSQINTGSTGGKQMYVPSTSPTGLGNCNGYVADTDTCIKLSGAVVGNTFVSFSSPIYYPFSWTTIESTTSPGIQQWFAATPSGKRKTVNLLDFSQSNGGINGSTPSYVGVSSYLALFTPGTQDFLNAVETGNTCTGQYTGHVNINASRSASATAVVTLANHGYTTGQTIWVNATSGSGTFAQYSNTTTGVVITVTGANTFTYNTGTSATDTAVLTLVADSESYVVPYELPYLAARQAFLKAVHNHFTSTYTNASGGTAAQLGYWRNGPSAGGETYTYCYTNLQALAAPYTLATDTATTPGTGTDCFVGGGCTTWGFVDYYKNDIIFQQSLKSYMRLANSLNPGGTGGAGTNWGYPRTEVVAAAAGNNGSGLLDIVGEQGVSLADITSYANNPSQSFSTLGAANVCGNDGCNMTDTYSSSGQWLEIQPISISAYDDGNCTTQAKSGTNHCAVPSTGAGGDSGDMRQWLGFLSQRSSTDGTNTLTFPGQVIILEGYYRDLALALDPNFATVGTGGNYSNPAGNYTWWTAAYQLTAFQAVGLGSGCGTQYSTGTIQGGSTGNCSYAQALLNFHGQH